MSSLHSRIWGKILSSLDYRTGIVCSISLCGFANLSSLGICVSGIAVLCPEKEEYTFKTGIQSNARWCIRKYLKCDDRRTDHTVLI